MLTDIDLLAWYTKLGIAENARAVVDHIRLEEGLRHTVDYFRGLTTTVA